MLKHFLCHPIGFPFFMVGFIPLSFPSYPLVNIHSLRTGSHGPVEIVDLPMKNGDLPMTNGDLPMKNGDLPMKNGDLPMNNGDLPMNNGDFPSFLVCLPGRVTPPRSQFLKG